MGQPQDQQPIEPVAQWSFTLSMLWPFNIGPDVWVTPSHKVISVATS